MTDMNLEKEPEKIASGIVMTLTNETLFKPGATVKINGIGDLAMTHKKWINKKAIVIKQCKSGLFLVQDIMSNEQTTVSKRNLELISEAW